MAHWTMYAQRWDEANCYFYFGDREYVQLYGDEAPIVPVELTEDPEGSYYGWIETGDDTPTMIQPHIHAFAIQFTYGIEAEIKAGKGQVVRLQVKELS